MKHFTQLKTLTGTLILLLGMMTIGKAQTTRYVKADALGTNNGASWTNAYTSLQSALAAAQSNDQIWVAAGTYKPTTGTDRNVSFVMKNGVALYGGFNGTETQLSERNWRSNATILSGDIGMTGVDTDNTYRVINNNFTAGSPLNNTAVLDGFIVEKGYADGGFPLNLGGGMWNAYASPKVQNCVFRNNLATSGAGIFNDNSETNVTNCLFTGNSCSVEGAALSNGGGTASAKAINCTFYGNTGGNSTIRNEVNATAISNCIIRGNTNGVLGGTVTYSIVQGGFSGTGNINTDPLFVNAAGGDFRLQQCSPAIDAGTNTNAPSTDFAVNARPFNATGVNNADMGAYEYQATYDVCTVCVNITGGIVYVKASASGSNNGSTWANAFTDLQSALDLARTYSCITQIWVAAGTYKPTTGTDRTISFSMVSGVAIYGGFNGTETQLSQRNWTANVTILSGEIGVAGIDDNSYHVIHNYFNGLNSSALLDGFTVRDGNANSTQETNSARGGGVHNRNSSPTFQNCIFTENNARLGGGMFFEQNSSTVTNCSFFNNGGAGIATNDFAYPIITNCTITGNSSNDVIYVAGFPTFINCIIWGSYNILHNLNSNITYSIVQGGHLGTGNLNADPLFVNAAGGDFRLQTCSPAIDAGTNTNAPATDFAGNARPFNATGVNNADMGAYEYQSSYDVCSVCANTTGGIVYVNVSASGSNNGSSWANAFTDLQSALTLARTYPSCVSQIWVVKGTYKPTSGTDRTISFSMVNGVAIYGGFNGTETQLSQRNWLTNVTTLSGDIGAAGDAGNSYTVVLAGSGVNTTAILDGFTVTGAAGGTYAAGIYADNGSPTISHCLLTGNSSTVFGGGLACYNASPIVTGCTFSGNTSTAGGGMANGFGGMPIVTNCLFINNTATYFAGGGGLFSQNASMTLTNCTFSGNSSESIHCNVAINISNCVIWGNPLRFYNANASISNCIVEGGYNLCNNCPNGNGNANPLFVNAAGGDFRLQACSPALNAGDPATTSATVGNVDLAGNPRFFNNGRVDIGTYEYQGTFDAVAPVAQVTNSVCTTFGGTASGGSISTPSGTCPVGSTVQYSTDNGNNWSTTLPIYAQSGPAQTILTRCACDANPASFGPTNSVTTTPGTCLACPDLTSTAPAVQVTNSVCTTFGGTASGGLISAPSSSCPAGSTLQYSTDNGGNWSTTLPIYAQSGPAQTILTRCNCNADAGTSSPTSTMTTTPGTCPACPDLTSTAPAVQVTNSVCTTFGGTASGGSISAPSGTCPVGSTLQYSTDNGNNWSTTLPIYAQSGPAQTILTRCNCNADAGTSSPTSTMTTTPGTCPACPGSLSAAPAVQVTNSVCTTFGGTASGGNISAPSGTCPVGSTLQYSTDNGNNWSTTLPIYAQSGPAQTILTRCNCNADAGTSSPTSTMTTTPGTCPACPDLTSTAPAVQVANSVCTTFGGTASGGLISAPSSSCPAGSTLQYSTDNGNNWSTTLPIYAQSGPAQTILTRCNCNAEPTTSSQTSTVTTVPGTCPACPVLTSAAPAVQVTNSVCTTFGGTASGGLISAPSSSCPAGSTLQYSADNGGNWNKTLPTYAQTGSAQTILTRCTCDANPATSSPTNSITTVPGTCPNCPVLTAAAPAVQVTNSTCQAGCTVGGGSISAPGTNCPVGATLQYRLNGAEWNTTLPTYAQTGPAQTIQTRCVCNADASQFSPESAVTTVPGTVPALIVPANGSATVSCPTLAIQPLPPVVNDCNGNPIVPSNPEITNSPNPLTCEGTRTYTYNYVCGTNTATWSFVYTIKREPFTISTANGSATVYDPSLAVAPTPPTVVSHCGEMLTPSDPVIANNPNPLLCEGTRTYAYTYTDCEGNTATWSFVYTVLDNIAPSISCPANLVACEGQTITFTPPVGTDNCPGAVTTQIAGLPAGSVFPVGVTTNTFKVTATNRQSTTCSFTVTVQGKPTITLATLQQTLNEGNSQTFCDTDANPVNGLQFTVSGACVVGTPVWRVQVGSGAWSEWSTNPPITQSSTNQPHRYQAACDATCQVTYTSPIELTINYRASTPQNVSLAADGTTVLAGEEKSLCDQAGNSITFNASCGMGERLLYSVDGGIYLPEVPTQIVDSKFHNYRVRCQKSDGTASCVESESGVMRLKISTIAIIPLASLTVTSGCGTPLAFGGTATCGSLTTIWHNAATNVALPNLPTTTPNETSSFYARCQNEAGCLSEPSNTVTFTLTPVSDPPIISSNAEIVCMGTQVKISANCPAGSNAFWNTGVATNSFQVSFNNVTRQTYWARCVFANGCQSPESIKKTILWKAFELTVINIGQSKSAIKTNDRAAWASQFVTPDGGPSLDNSTESNPTLYFSENVNKTGPRYWTIHADACTLGTNGSLTFDMLASPEVGVQRSFNTHENNAPYFMYANREGYTELYAQNHPAYGFYQDNGSGGNVYDTGLPKGLYKLGVRYWDQKGQGSIYPSTRQPAGNVLAYQEYWFRIQSQNGVGVGSAREAVENEERRTENGAFAQVMPNPVSNTLHLKVTDAKGQKVKANLLDASGRTLLQRAFVPESNQHQEEFEVSHLANGMYFLKVTAADKQATLKVVKVQ